MSYQISPDFAGAPFHVKLQEPNYVSAGADAELDDSIVGGGLVQTFAMGGTEPGHETGGNCDLEGSCLRELPSPKRPFTLADSMAMATYADFLPTLQHLKAHDWTPVEDYWPIGEEGHVPARKFQIGDAGFIEDTGLLPMLQRKAKKAAMFLFVGPGQELNTSIDWCGLSDDIRKGEFDPSTFTAAGNICDSLYTIFGYGYDDGQWHKSHNAVFKQSDMFEVACELKKLKVQGKPLVYARSHQVQANRYWGIQPYAVDILYVYNDRVPEFEAKLPADTQESLQTDMKGFPTDLPAGLYLKPRIIKLMAAQFEYNVKQNEQLVRSFFESS